MWSDVLEFEIAILFINLALIEVPYVWKEYSVISLWEILSSQLGILSSLGGIVQESEHHPTHLFSVVSLTNLDYGFNNVRLKLSYLFSATLEA